MQEDMEEDVNSNTSSTGKDTQPLTTVGSTTMTSMLQNSSKSSTVQTNPHGWTRGIKRHPILLESPHLPTPLKAFKETSSPMHFTLSSHLLNMYATTIRGPSPVALPDIYNDETLVRVLTPSPTPALIPLPPSDTRMVASTRVASPDYMPCTPSPVYYWMPEDEDIQGNMGTAAEHAAFVAAC
jgi:hypothetical protein